MWAVTSGFALRASGEAVPIRTRLNTFSTSVGERQGREGQVLDLSILGPPKAKILLDATRSGAQEGAAFGASSVTGQRAHGSPAALAEGLPAREWRGVDRTQEGCLMSNAMRGWTVLLIVALVAL